MGSMAEKIEKVEKKSVFVGGNGQVSTGTHSSELEHARDIARRYRCEFVDLHDFQLHHDLFTKIPPRLMFSYNFVPLEETHDGRLAIAIADPSQLMMIDEISLLLGKRIVTKVATLASSPSGCWKTPAKASRLTWSAKKKVATKAFRLTS